jgi:protein SCO1/2/putative membrane protein
MRRFLAGALGALFLVSGCASEPYAPAYDPLHQDLDKEVPAFTLTDQNGRAVTRDDLLGKVWVVNFFFSHCAGDCSKTNAAMARLQHDLANEPDFRLVGLSVDPRRDTPAVLHVFADRWAADPGRWHFLTGEQQAVRRLIKEGFFQAVEDNPQGKPGFEVIHTFTLMVVDQKGQLRGYVDGTDPTQIPHVEERVRELLHPPHPVAEAGRYFPALNASLNGLCGVLLLAGYTAVRRGRLRTHKALMLSALGVSILFLSSYLYYHLAIRHGQPTLFPGQGWVRPVYFAILLSHTALAAVVAPLALITTYLGLRNRLTRHVRLARWTFPLWLYVSVTGVVVYVMLYHLYPPP